jgi:hypothetical protein
MKKSEIRRLEEFAEKFCLHWNKIRNEPDIMHEELE